MNRQNAAARLIFFFLSFVTCTAYWRTESSCVSRRCAANRKKIQRNKLGNYRRCKFGVGAHCLLAQDSSVRQKKYIGAAQVHPILNSSADFFNSLWRRTIHTVLSIHGDIAETLCFNLRKGKYIKIKTTDKLNVKQTSIAKVRDLIYCERLSPSRPPSLLIQTIFNVIVW